MLTNRSSPLFVLILLSFIFAKAAPVQQNSVVAYTVDLRALDYYDDGRIVETYRETRYVSANGNWRSIKRFHGGFVEETVGVAGRGVYNVDRKAKKLRFQTAYPARNPHAKIPSTSKHAKQIKLLGFEAYVVKIQHGGNTILVARAPALNGDVIQLISRNSGFSRVIEPTNISLGQPSGKSLYYEEYPVEYLKK